MNRIPLTGVRLKLARQATGKMSRLLLAIEFEKYNRQQKYEKGTGLPETHHTITDWERNNIPVKSVKLNLDYPLKEVANFFGVSPNLFIEEYENWNADSFQKNIRTAYKLKNQTYSSLEKIEEHNFVLCMALYTIIFLSLMTLSK
ncbi:hypothetical protein MHK_002125 [Candidatus Magnetomorum sp. HK-1]|nr:hypothetical protein MHK_002125 [Candidatus Magnetomorum sp. HK-1]